MTIMSSRKSLLLFLGWHKQHNPKRYLNTEINLFIHLLLSTIKSFITGYSGIDVFQHQ